MSRQNVEIVRRGIEAFMAGRLDEALAIYHPDVEWHTATDEPDAFRPYRGPEGLAEIVGTRADIWEEGFEQAAQFGEFIDAGSSVVVPMRARLRGRASGAEVEYRRLGCSRFAG